MDKQQDTSSNMPVPLLDVTEPVSRPQEVSTDSEQILHDTVNRREPLELSGRRETPHLALTLSGRLMGDLRAVVRVLIGAVKLRNPRDG